MDATHTAEDHYRRGVEALSADRGAEALAHFRSAHRLEPGSAVYASHYGLALGLVERRLDRALALCREAAKDEFFNPVHYHNLAKLHLAFGFKAEAVRYLRRGLMIDPDNGPILDEVRALGVRRRPPLGFLRRQNPLNRWVGRVMRGAGIGSDPAELTALGG
ncbi:MAG: tetratricopeptide repeat protein [Myxococcota bacterium]